MSDEGRAGGCGVVVREARAVQCETHMRRGAACATALGAGGSSCPSDVGACLRAVEPPHCRLLCHVTVSALGHTLYVNGMWRYPEIQTRSLSPRRRDPLRSTVRRTTSRVISVYGLSRNETGENPARPHRSAEHGAGGFPHRLESCRSKSDMCAQIREWLAKF